MIAVVVNGCPDRAEEERVELQDCLTVLEKKGLSHVVVVDGGFYAMHEFLYNAGEMEWLVDHDEEQCSVCSYYRLNHMMKKMKTSVNTTTQLLAAKAKSALQKVQESMNEPDGAGGMKELQEKAQDGLAALGKKGMSFWSKAVSWTKEKSNQLAEEVSKSISSAMNENEEKKEIPEGDLFTVDEWDDAVGV